MQEPTPSRRLAGIDDLLLYRLSRFSSSAGAMVIRLCEGGFGITRREWRVIGLMHLVGTGPAHSARSGAHLAGVVIVRRKGLAGARRAARQPPRGAGMSDP